MGGVWNQIRIVGKSQKQKLKKRVMESNRVVGGAMEKNKHPSKQSTNHLSYVPWLEGVKNNFESYKCLDEVDSS